MRVQVPSSGSGRIQYHELKLGSDPSRLDPDELGEGFIVKERGRPGAGNGRVEQPAEFIRIVMEIARENILAGRSGSGKPLCVNGE